MRNVEKIVLFRVCEGMYFKKRKLQKYNVRGFGSYLKDITLGFIARSHVFKVNTDRLKEEFVGNMQ